MSFQPHRLPFFVYGTLRTGGRNHAAHLSGRCTEVRTGLLEGVALHAGPGYPYAVPDLDRSVIGELITVRSELYPQVLAELDRLEGCLPDGTGYYVRREMTVLADDRRPVPAWVYLAGPTVEAALHRHPALIPSGDWQRHHRPAHG